MQNASSPTFLNYLRFLNLIFEKILSKIGHNKLSESEKLEHSLFLKIK